MSKSRTLAFLVGILLAVLVTWFGNVNLRTQTGTFAASLRGRVVDLVGAVVPGVTVTLLSHQIGFQRTFTISTARQHVFTSVPVGRYRLKVEKKQVSERTSSRGLPWHPRKPLLKT